MASLNVHSINSIKAFPLSRAVYWAKKGGFTALDQGLLAVNGFLVNIILARWLNPEQYGAFAVVYSVLMLIGTLYSAVIVEPMMFFGAGKYREKFRKYFGILIYIHWALTISISIILFIVVAALWLLGSESMAQIFAGLAFSLPLILHYWIVRGGFYTRLHAKWAVAGSISNLIFTLIIVFGLMRLGLLSPGSALIGLGFAGIASSAGLLYILRPQLRFRKSNPMTKMVLTDHWRYGRWVILAQGVFWASGQIIIVLVPIFLGLQASAKLAVLLNLFRPVHFLTQSAFLLIVPNFSALVSKGISTNFLMSQAKRFILLFAGAAFVYGMFILVFEDLVIYHLYAGKYDGYDGYSLLVFLLALSYTANAIVQVLNVFLRSVGKVRETVVVWGFSALTVLILSAPALLLGGLYGAVLLFACSYIIAAVAAWRKLLNMNLQEQPSNQHIV